MTRNFALHLTVLVTAISAACSRHGTTTPVAAAAPTGCRGRQIAVVSNNSTESIDILTRLGSDPTRIYVTTVAAGHREQIPLPQGARYVFAQPVGSTDRHATMPAPTRELVDIRYLCE